MPAACDFADWAHGDSGLFFLDFCADESCGKCAPCRVGTVQIYKLLDKITRGAATPADLETLRELCVMVQETSLCGLGQNAPNPVVSTLRYFYDEYEAHIRKHKCAAGVCALNEKPMSPAVVAPPRPKRKVARLDELEAV